MAPLRDGTYAEPSIPHSVTTAPTAISWGETHVTRTTCATLAAAILAVAALPITILPAQRVANARVQAVIDRPEFAHASWGMEFYDLDAKRTVLSLNGDKLFVPGSTTKIVTMATALETLGPEFRFRTRVYRTGPVRNGVLEGDLILVASGDPNLSGRAKPDGSYAFVDRDHSYGGMPLAADPLLVMRELATQVAARGIRSISGQVIVDATLFNEGDRELGTSVTLSPVAINDNVIDIVVTPGARAGDAVTVAVSPQTSYLTVQANLVTVDSGAQSTFVMVEDSTNRDHRTLVLQGGVPRGPASNPRWVVPVPSRFGEIVLAELLNSAGVKSIPRLASRAAPSAASLSYVDSMVVAEHLSLPLIAEATVLLKTSQNLHASNMPLLLGSLPAARAAKKSGFDLAHDWVLREQLDLNGAVQSDGAGGAAFFSPAFMTRLLATVAAKPWGSAFRSALPVLGRDGTLATIQVKSPGAGSVFAKTGTYGAYDALNRRSIVHGKGLAGYFTSRAGRRIAFAIYVNNIAVAGQDPAIVAGQALGEIASLAWESIR